MPPKKEKIAKPKKGEIAKPKKEQVTEQVVHEEPNTNPSPANSITKVAPIPSVTAQPIARDITTPIIQNNITSVIPNATHNTTTTISNEATPNPQQCNCAAEKIDDKYDVLLNDVQNINNGICAIIIIILICYLIYGAITIKNISDSPFYFCINYTRYASSVYYAFTALY